MFAFLDRDALDIILSAEVIFAAIFTLSLFIAVHSILTFLRQSGGLYTRLAEIDAEMDVLQASIPGKLERIRTRRRTLDPLQDEFKKIREYHARLLHLLRRAEEEERRQEESEEEEKDKRIQRKKLGLDAYI